MKALIAGETDPTKLSELGSPRLAATKSELSDALLGRIRPHRQFLIGQHLKTIEQLEETIVAFEARIEAALEPFRDVIERLKEVTGLSEISAQILIAEIGTDMRQFPTAGHLLSWAEASARSECLCGMPQEKQLLSGSVLAAVAVAASILTTAYHMLADGTFYHDLGAEHFARHNPARAAAKLANRIRNLGFQVEIRPAA